MKTIYIILSAGPLYCAYLIHLYVLLSAAALRFNRGDSWSSEFVVLCANSKKTLTGMELKQQYNREYYNKVSIKKKRRKKKIPKKKGKDKGYRHYLTIK